jgi:AraC-like DNA-binding protein/quercetin dioxygenase-like cupin family protein
MKLLHQENTDIRLFVPKTLDFPLHLHNVVEIAFVTGGSATAICGNQRFSLEAGDVFIAFPNQEHGYENTENIAGYVMIVPAQPYLTAFHSVFEQKIPTHPVLKKGQWEHTGILPLLDMAFSEWHSASKALMHGYALLTVSKLLPLLTLKDMPSGGAAAMQELLLYINHHYTEPLSRQEIAQAVGYNESYISHMFSDQLNTSLSGYITSLRISDAKQLLTDTDMTISQIAMQLGFGCIRSFNRAFLKETGITPTAYRATEQ